MSFELFSPLFTKIDTITGHFATDIVQKSITVITPIVSAGLSLSFILYGLLIVRGVIEAPIMEFLSRSFRIAIITGIALTGGFYQAHIAELIRTLPDALATSLLSDPATNASAATLIDTAAAASFDRASEAFSHAELFEASGIMYACFGAIIVISTAIALGIGGAFLILAKLALALLAGIGPFFVAALLWQPTSRFFDLWLAQITNYVVLIILLAAVFGLMLSIFGGYMQDMAFDGVQKVGYALGGSVILAVAMLVILLQLPNIAAGLAGGTGLGYLWELRSLGNGGASFYSTSKHMVSAGSRGISAAPNRSMPEPRTSHGYFKSNVTKS